MENNLNSRPINYKFWKDSKMMGMILLIVTVTLQIFAFMKVPVLTTINAYTIGMLMGATSPFFYIYISYIALTMIFKDSTKLPGWIKITKISYWFVVLSVIFIIASSGHYQSKIKASWTTIGTENFKAMEYWFNNEFTSQPAWYPASTWGGVLGAFLYSIFSTATSGVGAFIISVSLVAISLSILITGTSVGLYKGSIKKQNMNLAKKEIKEGEEESFGKAKGIDEKIDENKNNPFPFDDPFE